MKKKYKKGFFLSETMVVMAIVTIVIIAVFKIFSTTYTKYKETENYNTINAVNALANVKKYFESFGEIDSTTLLNNSSYIELTNYEDFSSDLYTKIKEEYNIESIYLINMSTISNDLNNFDITMKKYINSLSNNSGIILLINTDGNKYTSTNIINSKPILVGDSDNEYAVYVNIGDEFVDPGYTNWDGDPPTISWENDVEINTDTIGIYYLYYDFDGYVLIRKVEVNYFNNSFQYTGGVQIFPVPKSGYYKIELWGAQGGSNVGLEGSMAGNVGGKGSYTKGIIFLDKNDILNFYVGGKGNNATAVNQTSTKGYNGGGIAGYVASTTSMKGAGGGGGATDVRFNSELLQSRIMVAGGGGGAANWVSPKAGGVGGGLIGAAGDNYNSGSNAYTNAGGGSQITGGIAGVGSETATAGTFGIGGNAYSTYGGGGGGGYYGGGGGSVNSNVVGSGAGGSSYISGHSGCIAINNTNPITAKCSVTVTNSTLITQDYVNINASCSEHFSGKVFSETKMIDGAGYSWTNNRAELSEDILMPNPVGGYYESGVGHSGNGYAKINFVGTSLD